MLIRHCAPTLAGIKTGAIFSCSYATADQMRASLRVFNRRLGQKGLRLLPIRYRDGRALIYVYRPSRLLHDLRQHEARCILRDCGYGTEQTGRYLTCLRNRLHACKEFPHEIGLFLGYPPEDVRGFMQEKSMDGGNSCKCVGYWKVYGDEGRACALFAKYRKCTAVYTSLWTSGRSIEKLTVATK